jgi:hypothetical protein
MFKIGKSIFMNFSEGTESEPPSESLSSLSFSPSAFSLPGDFQGEIARRAFLNSCYRAFLVKLLSSLKIVLQLKYFKCK